MKTFTVKNHRQIALTESGDYTVTLAAPGASAEILGAFKLNGTDKLAVNLTVIHQAPHTSARTVVRATADGQAQAVINGTVIVGKQAAGSDSFLTENVLLLSPQAKAETIPNLEILTDDVTCSHAATVGEIDEEQLFYLTARGVTMDHAKQLIAESFLKDVTTRIKKS